MHNKYYFMGVFNVLMCSTNKCGCGVSLHFITCCYIYFLWGSHLQRQNGRSRLGREKLSQPSLHFVAAVGMFISWDNIQSALILMAAAIHLTYHLFNFTILHHSCLCAVYTYIFTILIIYTYFVREFRNFYCILFQDPKFIWQLGSESKSFISPWLGNHKSQLKLTPFH